MNDPASPAPPFRPLSVRVTFWVLLYSTAFTLVMTLVLVGIHYLEERENAIAELHFIANAYRKSLGATLWELDMPAARLQLEAIAQFPMVGHAELTTSIGQRLRAGAKKARRDGDDGGAPPVTIDLTSPERPGQVVGQLRLHVDHPALLRATGNDALRILAGETVKGLLFGVLLAWLIARLVTRHVAHIARSVATLAPESLNRPLSLHRRRPPHRDELDQLTDEINRLHQRLHQHITMQKSLEGQLREHRDGLAQMVADRTRSLERLREFHAMIIGVMTRFLNVPLARTAAAVENGLAAFCGYFEARRCLLFTHGGEEQGFRVAHAWPPLRQDAALQLDGMRGLLMQVLHARAWICVSAPAGLALPAEQRDLLASLETTACTIVCIETQGDTVGLLCLAGVAIPSDSPDARLLQLAAQVAANMLGHEAAQADLMLTQRALQAANAELQALARHDALTGLANRRQFDEMKDLEFRRAQRNGTPLSVLMADIDEFKRYNDHYGHAAGDACLAAVSRCMADLFGRAGELPARLGGEEFAVLLPNVGAADALRLAESLRGAVWNLDLPHAASSVAPRVTISIGTATLRPGHHRDFEQLLKDADTALYRAKRARNCVAAAE